MTACVNNTEKKAKGGVFQSKVLRAAMAGVLAVGLMPAMALAAEPAESEAAPLATVTPADDFSAGKVTAAVDNGDKAVDTADRAEWTVDGEAHYVIPTQVTTGKGTKVDMEVTDEWTKNIDLVQKGDSENKFQVNYYIDDDGTTPIPGTKVQGTQVDDLDGMTTPGTYYAVVEALAGDYDDGVVAYEFGIAAKSLKGASFYEVGKDAEDCSDTEFVFKNDEFKFGYAEGQLWLQINGEKLPAGSFGVAGVYSEGSVVGVDSKVTPLKAGKYVAVLNGLGDYTGSQVQVPFTIEAFDISKADIAVGLTKSGSAPAIASIDGVKAADTNLDELLTMTFKSSNNGDSLVQNPGTYTFTVELDPAKFLDFGTSVINEKDVTFDVVDGTATDLSGAIMYGDADTTLASSYNVNLSDEKSLFGADKIKVMNGDEELAADKYDVAVTDAEGNEADVADLSTPGTWTVTVTVDPAANGYKLYGSATTTVTVISGEIQSAKDVTVMYDGKVVANSFEATYDGTDLLDKLEVTVETEDGEKTLVEGADYDVKVLDADDKEVSEVVNAGSYELQITSDSWKDQDTKQFLSETLDMTVYALQPTYIRAAGMKTLYTAGAGKEAAGATGLPYTGSEIVPTFEYTTDDVKADFDGDVTAEGIEWKALPENAYDAKYQRAQKDVKVLEAQEYVVVFGEDAEDEVMSGNFDLDGVPFYGGKSDGKLWVVNTETFADVPAAEWFAEPVTLAEALGYVNGYYGTKLFGANDKITRADVVCILFNMAGGDSLDEGSSNQWIQYATQFEDVDAAQYYARALGWAVKSGVVNGYGDGTTFGPNDQITREQTAAMIANYAKAMGKYQAASDVEGTLAAYADGAEVDAWAAAEVAWAVENGVMGNGEQLWPLAQITRAEVAAMAVNYQPAKL